jgi:glycerate 2-kinase
MTPSVLQKMRQDAVDIFHAGLRAVDPIAIIQKNVILHQDHITICGKQMVMSDVRNLYIIGAGKASGAMAAAMETILEGRITDGCVIVKYGHGADLKQISLVEAGHPVPDINGQQGAQEIRELCKKAGEKDLVICLLSGGGSALMPAPAQGLTLSDKQKTSQVLLDCGASIHEINTIRKHLSRIKGGQLALTAHPARMITLILSDVVGDDLDIIASGPTVPDPGTFQDCVGIISKYAIAGKLPRVVSEHLAGGVNGQIVETPKTDHPAFDNTDHFIIGNSLHALMSAKEYAESLGYHTIMLTSLLTGETRDAAEFHASIIQEIFQSGHPVKPPACLLSGGETTVTLQGDGKGGRNLEFVLASLAPLKNLAPLVCLSAGTDGTDGPTDAAGAIMDSNTLMRADVKKLDPTAYLANNDSYHFFQGLGDLMKTGPTRTNVMDIRIGLVGKTQG